MARYRAGSIVARNYLAQARVFARSFAEHNPSVELKTLIIDGTESDRSQPGVGTVVLPADLSLDPDQLHSMMLIYDVMELSTALKPALLGALLEGADAAAYFDPDIRVYADLTDVFDIAAMHGIVLTPHDLSPVPRDGLDHSEATIMHAGIYNLGFIAVSQQARPFLSWWHERLAEDAIVDFSKALFTDQRWVDWVPSLFGGTILRDRGLNAAYWNLHERPLSRVDGRVYAGTDLLRFFHFSGYNPERPWMLTSHLSGTRDRPRILLSELPELRALCESYASELAEFDHSTLRRTEYGLSRLPNGLSITPGVRRLARLILKGELESADSYPDPFDDPQSFTDWLTRRGWGFGSISLAQYSVWLSRPDLSDAFPDVMGKDGPNFAKWCREDSQVPRWLREADDLATSVTPDASAPPILLARPYGWSVLAYASAELGIGESGRRVADIVAVAGQPMELVGTRLGTSSRQQHVTLRPVNDRPTFENVITCINADSIGPIAKRLGLDQVSGAHVGVWFWELEKVPDQFSQASALLDEVWTASAFTQTALQAAIDKPVHLIRLPIDVPDRPTGFTRRSLGMPDNRFIFMTVFDYFSIYERKNPIGTIRAYLAAFGPDDGATLIVKSVNGDRRIADREHVRSAALGRPDILFIDEYRTSAQLRAMIELADSFVSLHRGEGYGLNIADAYAFGTPAIATAYSGNLEFMTEETGVLVPYSLIDVPPGSDPYPAGAVWADPDLDAASSAMRRIFDEPAFARALAARAKDHVEREHSMSMAVASVRPRLRERNLL